MFYWYLFICFQSDQIYIIVGLRFRLYFCFILKETSGISCETKVEFSTQRETSSHSSPVQRLLPDDETGGTVRSSFHCLYLM